MSTTLLQLRQLPYNDLAQYEFTNNIIGYHRWGNSRYNGLAVQVNKRYSKDFSYLAAYTWSHNFDDSTATNFSTILSPRRTRDFQNMRAEWASSALDRRHRFTVTPIYDFKPFPNGNWILKNIVGNRILPRVRGDAWRSVHVRVRQPGRHGHGQRGESTGSATGTYWGVRVALLGLRCLARCLRLISRAFAKSAIVFRSK